MNETREYGGHEGVARMAERVVVHSYTRDWKLTLNITSYVGVWPLVFIDDLNNAEQILLLELLQGFGNLLVVVVFGLLSSKTLLLGTVIVVGGERTSFAQTLLQILGWVLESDSMCLIVLFLVEVKIVDNWC